MRRLRALLLRFGEMFRKHDRDAEVAAELESHIQLHIDDGVRAGMTPEEARREALMKLGGIEQTKQEYRERQGLPWLETLMQDIRFGARMMLKNPGFTVVAALTLALGIGANTAIFSLVNGILLRPLPFAKPSELVSVTGTYPKGAFVALREQIQSLDVAGYAEGHEFNLTGRGEPVRLTGTMVSAEFFSVLGARPELGRTFYAGEDKAGQDGYAILSHALWQQQFGGDATIIGKSIELEGVSRQVVGVMPARFRFPSAKAQIWIPLHNDPREHGYWADDFMPIIGRLRPGAKIPQARAEVRLFQERVFQLFPWPMPKDWNADISVIELQRGMVADVRARLFLLLGAVSLILLIACVNVANLALSRGATREKEIAVRTAMGAARSRVLRQLLTESILTGLLGGLLGIILATQGLRLLKSVLPADTPRLGDAHIDLGVLAFTGALGIFTGVLFGLAPALRSSRAALSNALSSGTRGAAVNVSHRLRSGLAVAEIAFAVLLVIAAGLLIRSFWTLSHTDPGFRPERLISARITPNQSFCDDPARCFSFYRELLNGVQNSPGVSGATLVNNLPLSGDVTKRAMALEDYNPPNPLLFPLFWLEVVSPDYSRVMGIPLLAGRWFNQADESGNPAVVIVDAATARRFWPGQNPVGKRVQFARETEWRTVVGVVADVRAYNLQRNTPEWMDGTLYVPYSLKATNEDERIPTQMSLVLKTAMDNSQMGTLLRGIVSALNGDIAVGEVKTMRRVVSESVSTPASTTFLFIAFAGLALVLGVIGIYGVLAFLVSTRTREIGIRLAVGALPRDVLWLVLKDGARFSLMGISFGLVSAFAVTRLLAGQLYGVSPADPVTFVTAAALMAIVTLLACYIPTRRAMRVDPMIALRYE